MQQNVAPASCDAASIVPAVDLEDDNDDIMTWPGYREWSGGAGRPLECSEILDAALKIAQGHRSEPLVALCYHGTTHGFTVFEPARFGCITGHFGAVIYLSSDKGDSRRNYLATGGVITGRIDREVDRKFDEVENNPVLLGLPDDATDDDIRDALRKAVSAKLLGNAPRVMTCLAKLQNPFVVGSGQRIGVRIGGLDYEEIIDEHDDVTAVLKSYELASLADVYDLDDEDLRDEVEEKINEARWEAGEKVGRHIEDLVRSAIATTGVDTNPQELAGFFLQGIMEGDLTTERLEHIIRYQEPFYYAENKDGELCSPHLLSAIIEAFGYDSIILANPHHQFKGMGLYDDVIHIHLFESTKTQVKSTLRHGPFSNETADLHF